MKEPAMGEKAGGRDAKDAPAGEIEIGSRREQAGGDWEPPSRQNGGHLCEPQGRQRQRRANQEMSSRRGHGV